MVCVERCRAAHHSSEEWGSRSCWSRKRHDPQREFPALEAKGSLARAQGPTRYRSQSQKGY